MVLLHGINDNILIPNLYYLGVYQDETKKLIALQRDKYIFVNNRRYMAFGFSNQEASTMT